MGIAPSLGHLNSSRNDVQIYVEDTSDKNIWRELIKTFLPEGIKFSDPIPLGSRLRVLEECRRDQACNDNRKKLYIIDADLDLLKGKPKPKLKHLYRLRAYCIENYLLNENAIVKLATAIDTNATDDEAKSRLDMAAWIRSNEILFKDLFVCYAILNQVCEHEPTVSLNGQALTKASPRMDVLCPIKTYNRIFRLYRTARTHVTKERLRELRDKAVQNGARYEVCQFVSGKNYLLPLLITRIKREFGGQIQRGTLKVLLARYTTADVDKYLLRRMRSICR